MRMDKKQFLTAYEVVNHYDYDTLADIFHRYGEEKYAASIARGIVEERPIETTLELVEAIKRHVPEKYRREKHPARKVFQAIRIEVNNELEVLEESLKQALDLLSPGGRICVITFHSLEDRIVKETFRGVTELKEELKSLPVVPLEYLPKYRVVKTLTPTEEEILENPRARSAKLRVIERIG